MGEGEGRTGVEQTDEQVGRYGVTEKWRIGGKNESDGSESVISHGILGLSSRELRTFCDSKSLLIRLRNII